MLLILTQVPACTLKLKASQATQSLLPHAAERSSSVFETVGGGDAWGEFRGLLNVRAQPAIMRQRNLLLNDIAVSCYGAQKYAGMSNCIYILSHSNPIDLSMLALRAYIYIYRYMAQCRSDHAAQRSDCVRRYYCCGWKFGIS